jgi:hypothetical protein
MLCLQGLIVMPSLLLPNELRQMNTPGFFVLYNKDEASVVV